MVPAATLKAYEPLSAFESEERRYWERYAASKEATPPDTLLLSREHGLRSGTATMVAEREHGEVLTRRDIVLVCPHRTRLRLLASVLAFRRSIPAEVVGAFMPSDEVERAADEIDALRAAHPHWRNHILESSWEIPLHWFVPFDDAERELQLGEPNVRYETTLEEARGRCSRALAVLRESLPNPAVIAPVAGLERWLQEFDPTSVLVLDYGRLARLVPPHDLRDDRSCRDVWGAIDALASGDGERSAAHYMVVAERWSGIRRRENWN